MPLRCTATMTRPFEIGCELLRRPNYDARMAHLNGKDAASQCTPPEALRNGFDFGEFRHGAIYQRGPERASGSRSLPGVS